MNAAAYLGHRYLGIDGAKMHLGRGDEIISYILLAVNEFDSTRKRQSCLFQRSDGSYVLFIKGADNVILDRAASDQDFTILNKYIHRYMMLTIIVKTTKT